MMRTSMLFTQHSFYVTEKQTINFKTILPFSVSRTLFLDFISII